MNSLTNTQINNNYIKNSATYLRKNNQLEGHSVKRIPLVFSVIKCITACSSFDIPLPEFILVSHERRIHAQIIFFSDPLLLMICVFLNCSTPNQLLTLILSVPGLVTIIIFSYMCTVKTYKFD